MSKYTTEVKFICENASSLYESEGYNSINEVITKAIPKIFDFTYPIFDENYRGVLERKILKHYYTREICEETVGLWKLRLDTRLNEIMPYYNKLYESELIEFDPFTDTNYTKTSKKDTVGKITDEGTDEGNSTRTDELKSERVDELHEETTSDRVDKYSDTPQGAITDLLNDKYLTNARVNNDVGSTDNTGSQTIENTGTVTNENTLNRHNDRDITNTDDYIEKVIGKVNSTNYSELLMKFRDTFMNIDMLIIDELGDLFLNLW